MDFRKLQAFSRVYELHSFSKAAKDLFLSQPTISTHVLSLESELGVKLFDRIGRTVMPTQAGQILYSGVRGMFKVLEETKAEIFDLKNQVCGQVVVGGSTIPANYLLPAVLSDFRKQYPDVCVELRIKDSIQVCQDVLGGELDFGIVGGFADHFDLEHSLLMNDTLHIIVSPDMNLDLTQASRLEHLVNMPWVQREKGSGTRQAFENALMECGTASSELKVSTIVQSTEAVVRCVLAGAGAGVTSGLAVKKYIDSGELIQVDIPGLVIKRNFYIVWHRRRSVFTCAKRLIESVKEHIRRI